MIFYIQLILLSLLVHTFAMIEDYKSGDVHFNAPPKFTMDMKDKYARIPDKPNYSSKNKKHKKKQKKHKDLYVEIDQDFIGDGNQELSPDERMKQSEMFEERRQKHEEQMLNIQKLHEKESEEQELKELKLSRKEQKARTPYNMKRRIDRLWKRAKKAGMDQDTLAAIRSELDAIQKPMPTSKNSEMEIMEIEGIGGDLTDIDERLAKLWEVELRILAEIDSYVRDEL